MVGTLVFSLFLSWIQVSSDTYIVKSSAGEERAKRVLKELEGFHQLIGSTLVFRNTQLPELPIEVLLIGDEPTLKELEPEYNGRKVPVAGYFQAGPDRDFIVLSGRVFPETLTSVVYHELTHYFIARGLRSRPTWLNEGLAEYFSTAEIRDDEISLGAVSLDRLQLLKTTTPLPLKDFFAVDSTSPYYNESSKASVYYAQAWAFMHYMMHGEHAARFREYLSALQKADADLLQHLRVSERDLDLGFQNYLRASIQRPTRSVVKTASDDTTIHTESIPDAEAQMSIAEIFLSRGQLPEARRHLEVLAAQTPDSTRVSYYRGVLARIAGDPAARDFFVDALLDPFLAPRAAVQLVNMGDMQIPAVKTILEDAAATATRNAEVYLALTKIYTEDLRRLEETVHLAQQAAAAPPPLIPRPPEETAAEPAVDWKPYMGSTFHNIGYELLSGSEKRPRVIRVMTPYYPPELLDQKVSGEVVLDLQVTEEGKVSGIWLISSVPEVFGGLAAASVRQWEFEPVSAKIRMILRFKP
jgi:TonB family protein